MQSQAIHLRVIMQAVVEVERFIISEDLNGSSDQEKASNMRPFHYRSRNMHVLPLPFTKHGDVMLDHGIWEMR